MNHRRALLLVAVIGAVLLTWAAARYARQFDGRADGDVGEAADAAETGERLTLRFFRNPATAPAFTVRDLDGREISSASWRGKVVILNFWATWCPPCRAEIPDLVALQDKYRDRLVVIGISEDEAPPEVVEAVRGAAQRQLPDRDDDARARRRCSRASAHSRRRSSSTVNHASCRSTSAC